MCHSQEGLCKLYPPILQHGWRRASSLRETLSPIQDNKLIQQFAPKISPSELSLPRETRRTLAQLRTNKSPILISYLHKVDETHYHSPLCKTHPHTTEHLFNCTHVYTSNNILDLWMSAGRVVALLARWKGPN